MAQQRSGVFNTIAMIAAFITIGVFLYWLAVASEPAEVAVAEEEDPVQSVTLGAFSQNPPMYQNTQIRIEAVPVQRLVGDHSFLTVFPDSTPYMVSMDRSLSDQGVQVLPGVNATIVGSVEAISDSIFQDWVADSLFASEAEQEAIAAVGSRFIAEEIVVAGPEGGMEGDTTGGATDEAPAEDAQP